MNEVIEEARAVIELRIKEIRNELTHLQGALDHLTRANGRRPASTRRRRRKRVTANGKPGAPADGRRAKRGQRQAEFLKALESRSGEPMSAIATDMGVVPQQLYPIAKRLLASDQIVKNGKGYVLSGSAGQQTGTAA